MIEIKEEVKIGNIILEKGDKIKVLTEYDDSELNSINEWLEDNSEGFDSIDEVMIELEGEFSFDVSQYRQDVYEWFKNHNISIIN